MPDASGAYTRRNSAAAVIAPPCSRLSFSEHGRASFGDMLEWNQVTPLLDVLRRIATTGQEPERQAAAAAFAKVFTKQDSEEMLSGTLPL